MTPPLFPKFKQYDLPNHTNYFCYIHRDVLKYNFNSERNIDDKFVILYVIIYKEDFNHFAIEVKSNSGKQFYSKYIYYKNCLAVIESI